MTCMGLLPRVNGDLLYLFKESREVAAVHKIFDMDNPFFAFMGRAADYVILNLLFLLTSLPVFTAGASLGALHESLRRLREGTEGSLPRTYMQAFLRSFGRALPVWLALLASGLLLLFDVSLGAEFFPKGLRGPALAVLGGLLFLWMLCFSWVFLAPDLLQGGVLKSLKAALLLGVRRLPLSLLMMGIELLPVFFYHFFLRLFLGILLPVYVCAGFSLSGALIQYLAEGREE